MLNAQLLQVYVYIHQDVYGRIVHMADYVKSMVVAQRVADFIDPNILQQAIFQKRATPVDVTRSVFP
jgi:hypothetical protein